MRDERRSIPPIPQNEAGRIFVGTGVLKFFVTLAGTKRSDLVAGNLHGVSRAAGNNNPYWGRKSPQGLGWRRKPFNLPLDQIIALKSTDETRSNALQTAYSPGANYFQIQFSPRLLLL